MKIESFNTCSYGRADDNHNQKSYNPNPQIADTRSSKIQVEKATTLKLSIIPKLSNDLPELVIRYPRPGELEKLVESSSIESNLSRNRKLVCGQ